MLTKFISFAAISLVLLACAATEGGENGDPSAADTWSRQAESSTSIVLAPAAGSSFLSCERAAAEESGEPEGWRFVAHGTLDSVVARALLASVTYSSDPSAPDLMSSEVLTVGSIPFAVANVSKCVGNILAALDEIGERDPNSAEGPDLAVFGYLLARGGSFGPAGTGLSVALAITANHAPCEPPPPGDRYTSVTVRTDSVGDTEFGDPPTTAYHAPCRYDHGHVTLITTFKRQDRCDPRPPITQRYAAIICYPSRCRVTNATINNAGLIGQSRARAPTQAILDEQQGALSVGAFIAPDALPPVIGLDFRRGSDVRLARATISSDKYSWAAIATAMDVTVGVAQERVIAGARLTANMQLACTWRE